MADRRTVCVTGAGSGIGRAFAEALARAGDQVLLLDVDAEGLAATADVLGARSAVADVSDRPGVEAAVVGLLGATDRLDLLVHCAAILGPGTWATQPAADFERVLRVDFLGTANVIRAALPWLRRARGQVVTLASTAAVHGWPGSRPTRREVRRRGLHEASAPSWRDGVGVTTVFPLLIDTPLLSRPGTPPILRRGRRLPPEVVVQKALRAAARRRRRVYVPGTVRLLAALHGLAPSLLDWYGARYGLER
jgi:NAD(P)-dependent dehydrogenase (short-subunit alcohol dehydrogenase family)